MTTTNDVVATSEQLTFEWIETFEMEQAPVSLWQKLVKEEGEELLKEIVDLAWVLRGLQYAAERADNYALSHDASIEADIVLETASEIYGADVVQDAFTEVFRSNMSKLGDDGKPVRREDGKILKGPNYSPANLSSLVECSGFA